MVGDPYSLAFTFDTDQTPVPMSPDVFVDTPDMSFRYSGSAVLSIPSVNIVDATYSAFYDYSLFTDSATGILDRLHYSVRTVPGPGGEVVLSGILHQPNFDGRNLVRDFNTFVGNSGLIDFYFAPETIGYRTDTCFTSDCFFAGDVGRVTPVPVPPAGLLLFGALAGLAMVRRKRV